MARVTRTIVGVSFVLVPVLRLMRRARPARVSGDSMSPTLLDGDLIVTLTPRSVTAGDVVCFTDPRGVVAVKRVSDISEDEITVLGDNPAASTDSRAYGAIPLDRVAGRAVAVYWPPRRWRLIS